MNIFFKFVFVVALASSFGFVCATATYSALPDLAFDDCCSIFDDARYASMSDQDFVAAVSGLSTDTLLENLFSVRNELVHKASRSKLVCNIVRDRGVVLAKSQAWRTGGSVNDFCRELQQTSTVGAPQAPVFPAAPKSMYAGSADDSDDDFDQRVREASYAQERNSSLDSSYNTIGQPLMRQDTARDQMSLP